MLNQHLKPLYQTCANRGGILALQHAVDDLAVNGGVEQTKCLLQSFQTDFKAIARWVGTGFGKQQ